MIMIPNDTRIIAVVCNQFGDTGKGKFVDYFAEWADVSVRCTGGDNAGHTVYINGRAYAFHLVPSGIRLDGEGKINIIGNGTVINLESLCKELDILETTNMSYNNLRVSQDAFVILPQHIMRDRGNKSQTNGGLGTTGKGIGPSYMDKTARHGIRIGDLFRPDLAAKIQKSLALYPENDMSVDDIISQLQPFATRIKPLVRDTINEVQAFAKEGKRICIEGAQGFMLSLEWGTYPYVTSSDCSMQGTATGAGLAAKQVDICYGLVKFPFMTRVGAGPFPTEYGRHQSAEHCGTEGMSLEKELKRFGVPHTNDDGKIKYDNHHSTIVDMMNDNERFISGIGVRLAAGEYGATTGRPRRTGVTDAMIGAYAANVNGPRFILTKPDSIAGMCEFELCVGYEKAGSLRDGEYLQDVQPLFRTYEGYGDISDVKTYDCLPGGLKKAIADFEQLTGGRADIISNGPEREQTIWR